MRITAAWAAVLVAIFLPAMTGIWFFASSQARTETTVQMLDARTSKMEARIDAIATKLNVPQPAAPPIPYSVGRAGVTPANSPLAGIPSDRNPSPAVGAKAWP